MAKEQIQAAINELCLTMDAKFVPWSQSRNKDEKSPSLNWLVTIKRAGREILTTDYMAGSGHCPAYKDARHGHVGVMTLNRDAAVRQECERGRDSRLNNSALLPDFCDVLHSLTMDSSVLDEGSFENWCASLGHDTDSRKAESIYRACLDIALKLRSALGEDGLAKLRDATQDY